MGIFEKEINKQYPKMDELKTKKLAQENARYMTSVFTPTKMLHTLSFRQLNYIMNYFEDFMQNAPSSDFNGQTKNFMGEFNEIMKLFYVPELKSLNGRHLSIFADRINFAEEFGENYSTTYLTSFACLAQLHRHRTIDYEMQPITRDSSIWGYFIPPILKHSNKLENEWLSDLSNIGNFPQGTLIRVHESGKYTDFMSKIAERRCGHAQLEIMLNDSDTLAKFLNGTKKSNAEVYDALLAYDKGSRCTVPGLSCRGDSKCFFGPKYGIDRLI